MPFVDPALGVKLVYILGLTNVLFFLMVFFSCRCMAGIKFVNAMMKHGWYQKFYNRHCRYWWLLGISIFLHAAIAIDVFGSPFF
ncbi:MAG: hypothetical protein V1494_01350 [Candidatus Diapherotrites archaeon]